MTGEGTKDILPLMPRLYGHITKFFATLFGIFALLVMIAAWRMAYAPFQSTTWTPYIERGLAHLIPGAGVKVGQSLVAWDNRKQALNISCNDVEFTNPQGGKLATFKSASIKVRIWHVLRGGLLPQEFTADTARLYLTRDKEGLISYNIDNENRHKDKSKVEEAIDFALLQFVSDEMIEPRLKHMIDVKDVVLNVQDQLFGVDWSATIPEIKLDHDKEKVSGSARLDLIENGKSSSLQIAYGFDREQKLHNVSLAFQDIKPSAFAAQGSKFEGLKIAEFPLSGEVKISTDRDLNVAKASVAINGGKGFLNDQSMWEKPRALESIVLLAGYDRATAKLEMTKGEINFGGPKLNVTLDAKIAPPKDILWLKNKSDNGGFTVKVTLDDLPMDEFGSVWPKTIIPDARGWIVNSLSKGMFTHGEVTINGRGKLDDLENVELLSGGGKIYAKDGIVNYLVGMPDILNASAEASFDLDHMDIKILSGNTGAIELQPFTLVMDRFQEDIQHITIPIKLKGPVKDVLKVLDSPPLGYAKAIGLTPEDSAGTVEGSLTLRMPLLDALLLKDIDVRALAKIKGFEASKLVSGIAISRSDLDMDLTQDGFTLKGTVDLNKVPSKLVWESSFDTAKTKKPLHDATITAKVKGNEWGSFYGLDQLANVEGETPVTIKYTNVKDGFSKVAGTVDLKNANVQLRDIGWDKKAGTVAQLVFLLEIPSGKNMVFRSIDLNGQGIKVKGTAELDYNSGKLLSLKLSPLVLGRSNASVLYSKPLDPSLPVTITVDGEAFDMNGLDEEESEAKDTTSAPATGETAPKPPEEQTRAKEYRLNLIKLYTSEDGFMSSIKGHALRDQIGWKDVDIWGVAQGATPLTIKLMPDKGRLVFNLNTDNFGVALQGMGFGSGVKGGRIEINGESTAADPRTISGKIKLDSFVVTDLPVLARLLSAVSPFGFMDLITGDAEFDRLNANYKWKGDDVELSKLRAAGSVVGINLDGHLNIETGQASLYGTLVPFSFVNSIIGSIPLLGDVITGGSGGGIIAASFGVSGSLANPSISVNPVSLLTPGILRSIFFSNGDNGTEGPTGDVVPAPAPPEKVKSKNNLSKSN